MEIVDLCRLDKLYEETSGIIPTRFFTLIPPNNLETDIIYEIVREETLKQIRRLR
jgi:hypothetical protein